MNIKKILYIIFGCISFGLGAVGAVLPVLPTFPFLIFAAFCFARSSKKLDKWFKGTKLYKNPLYTLFDTFQCLAVSYFVFYVWCKKIYSEGE